MDIKLIFEVDKHPGAVLSNSYCSNYDFPSLYFLHLKNKTNLSLTLRFSLSKEHSQNTRNPLPMLCTADSSPGKTATFTSKHGKLSLLLHALLCQTQTMLLKQENTFLLLWERPGNVCRFQVTHRQCFLRKTTEKAQSINSFNTKEIRTRAQQSINPNAPHQHDFAHGCHFEESLLQK